MALPASGVISLSQVNTELGASSTATISMGSSAVRGLFGVASGAISMSDGYGKSSSWTATISSNQKELNLRTWALANGWNGSSAAIVTIGSGVYIWSDNTAVAGLTTGSFPGGLTIINNGYIIGKGGKGGGHSGQDPSPTQANLGNAEPTPGGPALSLSQNISITNNSYIAGGGGGGARGTGTGGGGAGGGETCTGTAGGAPGQTGARGVHYTDNYYYSEVSGQSGGRILPGVGGQQNAWTGYEAPPLSTVVLPGAGGASGSIGGTGGAGGSGGNAGAAVGGGGGWGAAGGTGVQGWCCNGWIYPTGRPGGACVQLNGYSVTWLANGTRWGTIS